jgi:carboxyl-terminal processing protease
MKAKVDKNIIIKITPIILFLGLIGGSFILGTKVNFSQTYLAEIENKNNEQVSKLDFDTFWDTWQILDKKFVKDKEIEGEEITNQDKIWGAIQGLTRSFGDPYTIFLPPSESEIFESDIEGSFEGIGMEIGIRDGFLIAISPLKDTPAERAGMKPKDKILEIDGKSSKNMDTTAAVKIIRGEKGTDVILLIEREGEDEPFEVAITRDVINIPTIDTEVKSSDGKTSSKNNDNIIDGVFIIRLYSFTAVSPNLFREALREFVENQEATKLIIDLRGNPGGYLEAATDIASWFLPIGKVVVTEDYGGKEPNKIHSSKGYDIFNDNLKMVILVDGGSASASEILAGALHEYGKATLVGTKTFGKGSVQELIKITSETSLKVTVARWLTPNGNSFSHDGIEPDVEIKITEDDIEYIKDGGDPQLDKAIEVLNAM